MDKNFSYAFCSITHIWGWATWRRVWQNFDINFPFWNECKNKRSSLFCNKLEEIYFSSFIPDVLKGAEGKSVWDVQYYFMLRLQHQLSVYPSVNLVTNIGLDDPNATHTAKGDSKKNLVPASPISFPLKHPQYVMPDKRIDYRGIKRQFFSYKRLAWYILQHTINACHL
jgi:hypothetical protein